jgi:hypothetical protein
MTDLPSWKAVETLYQIEELDRTEGLEIRIVHAYKDGIGYGGTVSAGTGLDRGRIQVMDWIGSNAPFYFSYPL